MTYIADMREGGNGRLPPPPCNNPVCVWSLQNECTWWKRIYLTDQHSSQEGGGGGDGGGVVTQLKIREWGNGNETTQGRYL